MTRRTRSHATAAGAVALTLLLAACGDGTDSEDGASGPADAQTMAEDHHDHDEDDHDDDHDHGDDDEDDDHAATEAAARTPRIALTYDGGLIVVDATSGEIEADLPLDGFNRINPAGDGRHVLVSTQGGWAVLDTGTWSSGHGDHDHYYTAAPQLHDVLVPADTPAHVVNHDGLTALFDDGTGEIIVVESEGWTDAVAGDAVEPVRTYAAEHAHHGVAIADAEGRLLVTIGDDTGRTGAYVVDADGTELDRSEQCPGVHGETVADGDLFIVGCEDGALILHDGHFHKASSPDDFGRIGNAFGVEDSAYVLGDYRSDPDGGIELSHISLIDADAETIQLVDIGSTYTWRGLARGTEGEALVLGSDGALRVYDAATGELERTIEVIDAWEVPEAWQEAHPALLELGGMAYVTDPSTNTLHAVDYAGGEVWRSWDLPHAPIEVAGATG